MDKKKIKREIFVCPLKWSFEFVVFKFGKGERMVYGLVDAWFVPTAQRPFDWCKTIY
jgi:hypothetical protein